MFGRGKKRRQAWQATAEELGFSFEKGPHSDRRIVGEHHLPQMYGSFDGQDVYVGVRSYTEAAGGDDIRTEATFVDVVFDVPLKRGLSVHRVGRASRFLSSFIGQSDVQIGDEQFDKSFHIAAVDPEQVKRLLLSGEVRARLSADLTHKFKPSLDDTRVRLEADGVVTSRAALEPQLGAAVALYREILSAWRQLPPSREERAIGPAWQQISLKRGLTADLRAMRMWGEVNGMPLACEVWLADKRHITAIRTMFVPPLAVGLVMKRKGAAAGIAKVFGAQDVEVGDPEFDKRYVIKGKDTDRLKAILSADARTALSNLDAVVGDLLVTDRLLELRLPGARGELAELDEMIGAVSAAASAMVAFRKPAPQGPFR